ncbi:MAG: YicC family protein [Proteobacteria bacterium]|nr:YicC family protein [Pseudomonadota bacterium]
MTAFARETLSTEQGDLTIELRSVNHRYLDCTFKLPEALRQLEPRFRDGANKKLARGKLDCMVRLQLNSESSSSLEIDNDRLDKLLQSAAAISQRLPQPGALSALDVLQFPGICQAEEVSFDVIISGAMTLFSDALHTLADSREREGEKLAEMVLSRLDGIEAELVTVRKLLPELMKQQRERVISRIAELNIEVDGNRLEQELVHLAQKADVEEELDRLDAHIAEVRRVLKKGGPCGRRLDFLMQELNREANTLSSKSQSSGTTMAAVELKVLIEQMREQIQNIE